MFPTRKITTMGGDVFRDEYSLTFDGSNDYIEIGSNLESTVFNSAFSVSLWVKLDDGRPSADEYFFGTKHGDDSIWGRIETDGDIQLFYKEGSAEEALVASAYFADGATEWTHLVFVVSDSAQAIYANGVSIAANTTSLDTSGFAQDTDRNFIIGARNNAGTIGDGIAGKISDFALYTKALSASEVAAIYNGREPYNHKEGSFAGNLYGWWRMGDGNSDNIKHLYIDNSASDSGSNIHSACTFATDTDNWAEYPGSTSNVERSTTISGPTGSTGVLKAIATAPSSSPSEWLGKLPITSGMENGKIYTASAWVYIPSAWSGTRHIYFTPSNSFQETVEITHQALYTIKDTWQYVSSTFLCGEDSGSGSVYMRAAGTDDWNATDFVYMDDFNLVEIDKPNSGLMVNMTTTDFVGDRP